MPLFDRKDKSRYTTFSRRSLVMTGGMTAVFGVLGWRLYNLQIENGDEYKVQAEANRVSQHLIAPPRGRIVDRFGVELANNRRNYRVMLVAEQATDGVAAALDRIGDVIELPEHQRQKVMRDIEQNKKFLPVPVAENLTWEEFARINLHLPYLPGVQPDVGETRAYPYGEGLSHILGYVAAVSVVDEQNEDDPLLALPGFRIGKRGIEKSFDSDLRGEAGASRDEVNAYGRIIRELSREPGTAGKDVWLTIDQQLQQFVDQRLGQESCACVVMDVQTGDVLALSSTPGFDPNLFNSAPFDPVLNPQGVPLGTFGNSPRKLCCNSSINNWDMGFYKDIPFTERLKMEFRSEVYNIWNHAQFFSIDGNVGNQGTTFGQPQKTRDPRLVQFALKLLF